MDFTVQDYDLRNAFEIERTLLLLSGFYPRRTKKLTCFYVISAFFNLFVAYGQLFSMVAQMAVDRKNLSKLTETLLFFMTHFTFLCKLMNFVYYKNKMLEIEDTLSKSIFYGHPYERLQLVKTRVESCQLVAKIFRVLCILVVLTYTLVPYLDEKGEKTLPLPGWLPYDTQKYYYPSVVFQVLSVSVSAYNNSSIDILTCMLITVASAEFDILKENLKNIDYKIDQENSKKAETLLNNCVDHHMEIVRFAYQVEDIFSKGIFLQFFASIVVICFTGFQMIVVPIPSVQFIFLVIYFSCMMCQIAMYCWYGHDIITTSDSIGEYFYMSNWYEADLPIRKNMFIFLERTKKPVILTAGKFVTLSLTTFTTDYDLCSVFSTEKKLLTLSGFYPSRTKEHRIVRFFSAFMNLLFSYLQLFSMIAEFVVEKNDISKLTDNLLFFMTHSTFLCKLSNFIYYRKRLLLVEDTLTGPIFYNFSHNQLKFLKVKIDSCKLVAKIFRVLCILCIIIYAFIPYLLNKLPLPGWLPWEIENFYNETVVFQLISASVSAYNNSTIDILTWKLITIASGEFEILKDNLKDLIYNSEEDLKKIEISFNNCIKHHTAVVDLVSTIEFIFSKGIFLQFFASVIVICVTGFQMLVVPFTSIQFAFLIMYFSCMMCQVAMYCWYGHDVMTTSDQIGQSCYMSNWYDSNLVVRKSITIFLERTKNPVFITAGKFVTLSLTTLTSILRSSYSYFAVLQRLYNEDA